MNHKDVVQTAHRFEGEISTGDVNAFSKELHDMKPADRVKVMRQIQDDMHKSNSNLPNIEFFNNADLKSIDESKDGVQTHFDFDQTTGNRTLKSVSGGQSIHSEVDTYDAATGKLTSESAVMESGTYNARYDAGTGTQTMEDYQDKNGSGRHIERDRNDTTSVADYRYTDHTTRHIERRGAVDVDVKTTDAQGNSEEKIYDPDTKHMVVRDVTNADKSGQFEKYDRNDGHLISIDKRAEDGTITHIKN